MHIHYAPPPISPQWLADAVLHAYPAHRASGRLIEELVHEYLRLWRLIVHYPDKRVVAPGPIIAVQRVHWTHRRRYFEDCMAYFNRYIFKECVWGGHQDVAGTLDTVRSYHEFYDTDLPPAWKDMQDAYNLGRAHLRLVQ